MASAALQTASAVLQRAMTQANNLSVHFHGLIIYTGTDFYEEQESSEEPLVFEEIQPSGLKALSDHLYTVKPLGKGLKNKSQVKSLLTICEDSFKFNEVLKAIGHVNGINSHAEEGFRHNHDECVKQQKESFNFNDFLQAIGHEKDPWLQSESTASKPLPRKPKENNSLVLCETEEIGLIQEDPPFGSPNCRSPKSPETSPVSFLDYSPDFTLAEIPSPSAQSDEDNLLIAEDLD